MLGARRRLGYPASALSRLSSCGRPRRTMAAMAAAARAGAPATAAAAGPLQYEIVARCSTTKARVGRMVLPHHVVDTPVFMPVGTQGTMKGLTTDQLEELGCQIILGNTYHLGTRPGPEVLREHGGLHGFMGWRRNLLTDSGGFQMVSLLKLANVTEEGVKFQSPHDGSELMLTPEKSIELQNDIGADIIMQLDDVVSSLVTGPRIEEAMYRSIRWLDRWVALAMRRHSIKAHKRPAEQSLFPIIQGGLDLNLRRICVQEFVLGDPPEMTKRPAAGFAIGGLSGGEDKDKFWRVVHACTDVLPVDKPRYCMGVGFAVDLVVCVALGVDMFDCVFPTRTARFGTALVPWGNMVLRNAQYAHDFRPLDPDCPCSTCNAMTERCRRHYTRAALHAIVTRETSACHLLSVHNIAFQMRLMRDMRTAITEDRFPDFVRSFMRTAHPKGAYPEWAVNALAAVNITL